MTATPSRLTVVIAELKGVKVLLCSPRLQSGKIDYYSSY